MSVRNCNYPWHSMTVTDRGEVLPCGHGSKPVGNLREQTPAEIWNGETMQALRTSILSGRIHAVCKSCDCPYQQRHPASASIEPRALIGDELAEAFDEEWYLERYPDAAQTVRRLRFASGFEHYATQGQLEGREFQLRSRRELPASAAVRNANLALLERARWATRLHSNPVDIVLQVATISLPREAASPHATAGAGHSRHMPLEIFERLLPFVATASRIVASGLGEPFLAPVFWRLVQHCADRDDLFIRASSSAYLVSPDSARRLLDSGLKEVCFSLDAATPETYARLRGGNLLHSRRGIEAMCAERRTHRRRSLEIFIGMTLLRENIEEAAAFVELAAELGVDGVVFSQFFLFGDHPVEAAERGGWPFARAEQRISLVPELAREHLDRARARALALGIAVQFQGNTHRYLSEPVTEVAAREMLQPAAGCSA
ncbi:MAG TPA: SPASM domain-containing protein [Opitutaceae bacterium]